MKNYILFLALTICTLGARAADLIVEENGAGGAYTTISAAITAAATGDRILITPRALDAPYVENLNNGSKNLQLLSTVEGTRWKLTGNVTEQTNSSFQIYGGDITGNISQFAGSTGSIRMANCKINGIVSGSTAGFLYLDNDSLFNTQILPYGGRVSGCYIRGTASFNNAIIVNSGSVGTDTVFIVGNTFDNPPGNPGEIVEWFSTSRYGYIANNLFMQRTAGAYGFPVFNGKTNGAFRNTVMNNTVVNVSGGAGNFGFYFAAAPADWRFVNNAVYTNPSIAYTGFGAAFISGGSVPGVFQYNYAKVTGSAFNFTVDATNVAASTMVLNTTDGSIISGDVINGGSPHESMLDLDLSRNDAGCFGGSYSKANFNTTPASPAARVLFMRTPRTVSTATPVGIVGEGFDK